MYDVGTALNLAQHGAGRIDEKWNKRFASMLTILGYEIEEAHHGQALQENEIHAPQPVGMGWQYPFPSIIVAKRRLVSESLHL